MSFLEAPCAVWCCALCCAVVSLGSHLSDRGQDIRRGEVLLRSAVSLSLSRAPSEGLTSPPAARSLPTGRRGYTGVMLPIS